MYMDGFKFSLSGDEHPCLNLFFADWTLDTKGKFYAALFGVFALAVIVEAISTFRYRIVRSVKKAHRRASSSSSQSQSQRSTQILRLFVTLLHGLQGLLGYLLMLATMTFSVELLLAVVLGLAVGYGIFFQYEEALGRLHVTSNPCCNFLEGEARETQTEQDEEIVLQEQQQPRQLVEQPDYGTGGEQQQQQQQDSHETEQVQSNESA